MYMPRRDKVRSRLISQLRRLTARTEGQDLIEYGVLIGLIAAATIASASVIGLKVPALYSATNAALPAGSGNPGNGNPGNGNPGNSDPVGNAGPGNPGNGNPGGGN
jgi:Flp pilus assembly pilin Flp